MARRWIMACVAVLMAGCSSGETDADTSRVSQPSIQVDSEVANSVADAPAPVAAAPIEWSLVVATDAGPGPRLDPPPDGFRLARAQVPNRLEVPRSVAAVFANGMSADGALVMVQLTAVEDGFVPNPANAEAVTIAGKPAVRSRRGSGTSQLVTLVAAAGWRADVHSVGVDSAAVERAIATLKVVGDRATVAFDESLSFSRVGVFPSIRPVSGDEYFGFTPARENSVVYERAGASITLTAGREVLTDRVPLSEFFFRSMPARRVAVGGAEAVLFETETGSVLVWAADGVGYTLTTEASELDPLVLAGDVGLYTDTEWEALTEGLDVTGTVEPTEAFEGLPAGENGWALTGEYPLPSSGRYILGAAIDGDDRVTLSADPIADQPDGRTVRDESTDLVSWSPADLGDVELPDGQRASVEGYATFDRGWITTFDGGDAGPFWALSKDEGRSWVSGAITSGLAGQPPGTEALLSFGIFTEGTVASCMGFRRQSDGTVSALLWSTSDGMTWSETVLQGAPGDGAVISDGVSVDGVPMVAGQFSSRLEPVRRAVVWRALPTGVERVALPSDPAQDARLEKLILLPDGSLVAIGAVTGVATSWVSGNAGETWSKPVAIGAAAQDPNSLSITDVVELPAGRLAVLIERTPRTGDSTIAVTDDKGRSWTELASPGAKDEVWFMFAIADDIIVGTHPGEGGRVAFYRRTVS